MLGELQASAYAPACVTEMGIYNLDALGKQHDDDPEHQGRVARASQQYRSGAIRVANESDTSRPG
jgi:hypothetical protein